MLSRSRLPPVGSAKEIASHHFSGDRLLVTIIKDSEHDRLNQLQQGG